MFVHGQKDLHFEYGMIRIRSEVLKEGKAFVVEQLWQQIINGAWAQLVVAVLCCWCRRRCIVRHRVVHQQLLMVQLQHTLTCTLVLMIGRRDCESTGEVVRRRRCLPAVATVDWRPQMRRRAKNCLLLQQARFAGWLPHEHPANHPLTLPNQKTITQATRIYHNRSSQNIRRMDGQMDK